MVAMILFWLVRTQRFRINGFWLKSYTPEEMRIRKSVHARMFDYRINGKHSRRMAAQRMVERFVFAARRSFRYLAQTYGRRKSQDRFVKFLTKTQQDRLVTFLVLLEKKKLRLIVAPRFVEGGKEFRHLDMQHGFALDGVLKNYVYGYFEGIDPLDSKGKIVLMYLAGEEGLVNLQELAFLLITGGISMMKPVEVFMDSGTIKEVKTLRDLLRVDYFYMMKKRQDKADLEKRIAEKGQTENADSVNSAVLNSNGKNGNANGNGHEEEGLKGMIASLSGEKDFKRIYAIVSRLDKKVLKEAYIRRFNLFSPYYADYFKARWENNPEDALKDLAEGEWSIDHQLDKEGYLDFERYHFSNRELFAELPSNLRSFGLKSTFHKANLKVKVEWRFVPWLGFWLPVQVAGIGGTLRNNRRVSTFIKDGQIVFMAYETVRGQWEDIIKEYQAQQCLSILPEDGRLVLPSERMRYKLNFGKRAGEILWFDLQPDGGLKDIQFLGDENPQEVLYAYQTGAGGSVKEMLGVGLSFRGAAMEGFRRSGRFWIGEYVLPKAERGKSIVRFRMRIAPYADLTDSFYYWFPVEFEEGRVKVAFDMSGVPYYLEAASKDGKRRQKIFTSRLMLFDGENPDGKTIDSFNIGISQQRLVRSMRWAFMGPQQTMKVTRLSLQELEGPEIMIGDYLVILPADYKNHEYAEISFGERSADAEYPFAPADLYLGKYESEDPHDPASLAFKAQKKCQLSFMPEKGVAFVAREHHSQIIAQQPLCPRDPAALICQFCERPFTDATLAGRLAAMPIGERIKALAEDRGMSDPEMARALEFKDAYTYRLNLLGSKSDGQWLVRYMLPLSLLLSVDPSWIILGVSHQQAACQCSWGQWLRFQRLRQGKTLQEMAGRIKMIDARIRHVKDANLAQLLVQFELERQVPAEDIYGFVEQAYGAEGRLPPPSQKRTSFHSNVGEELITKIERFIFKKDLRTARGARLNQAVFPFEAVPGAIKSFGRVRLLIPEVPGTEEVYNYLLTVRKLPFLPLALVVYAQISSDADVCMHYLPVGAYLPSPEGPQFVKLRAHYVLKALQGKRVPARWAKVKLQIYSRKDTVLGVNVDASTEGRMLYFPRSFIEEKGYHAGDWVLLKAMVLPTGERVVGMYGIRKEGADDRQMDLLIIFRPELLRIDRKYYIPVDEKEVKEVPLMPSCCEQWRRLLAEAQIL
ncbi:MAG TPA: hypothetical protein P5246_03320, partial [Candidatus Omnitrophota bacterium]|nr:hypothetical protein [Candidatus Omnitrophota bacterium]